MPTYQYECAACGSPLEVVQSFSEDALTVCPACGEAELKKIYGAVGVVFKGSGFYKTDSRKSSSETSSTTTKSTEASPSNNPSKATTQSVNSSTKTD